MGLYGTAPIDLGLIDLSPKEMMFWMYCPIKLPGQQMERCPANLRQFMPIIAAVDADLDNDRWVNSYVYLTAKTLWVSKDNPGNRPGWHSDGYMTDDFNYIWSDRCGTEFWQPNQLRPFSRDHHASLAEMEAAAAYEPQIVTYPDKHLLRLDEFVIHRVAENLTPGMRTFVKVSVSEHRYDLEGNSINHVFPRWEYVPRGVERNHTTSES
ncbi:hypothetical protein [Bradyrhizobium sp. DASA03007]|uniref:hypothetical protein n=1 Tax=unclassified Bradyrhizobium TaxID=2631580 RepID=UPI003F6F3BD6